MMVDPVARFHLRNGASFRGINWLANKSSPGLASSAGMMVNYLYDKESVSIYRDQFEQDPTQLPMAKQISDILQLS